jgi:hypothetical protein
VFPGRFLARSFRQMPDQRAHVGERDQIHDGRDCQRPGQGARPVGTPTWHHNKIAHELPAWQLPSLARLTPDAESVVGGKADAAKGWPKRRF